MDEKLSGHLQCYRLKIENLILGYECTSTMSRHEI